MACCSSSLSLDGVLCELCRQCFDYIIVSSKLLTGDEKTEHEQYWWHDIETLRHCARQQCRFCSLVLANWNDNENTPGREEFMKVESWGARLSLKRADKTFCLGRECDIIVVYPEVESLAVRFPHEQGILPPPKNSGSHFVVDFNVPEVKLPSIVSFKTYPNFHVDSPGSHPITSYDLSSTSTGSENTFEKIKTWLKCCETHPTCLRWTSRFYDSARLPTRLLEVSSGAENPKIRLVLRSELSVQDYRYVTLSHCWGSNLTIRLSQRNLASFQSSIPWSMLPRTFQETAIAVLNIGLTYLWIDALCIIQDSKDDWTHEAATMTDVYANCYLNISADASANGNEGLFRSRDPNKLRCFVVSWGDSNTKLLACCYFNQLWMDLKKKSPLYDRGWVIQERFLSPRVVHFSQNQIYWECTQLLTIESVPSRVDISRSRDHHGHRPKWYLCSNLPHNLQQQTEGLQRRYALWSELMETYSQAFLSFASDRPVAIAGLARLFCPLLGLQASDYNCGLWRPRFIHSMMWYALHHRLDGKDGRRKRIDQCTPSWSWFSVDVEVVRDSFDDDDWLPIAKLIEVQTSPCSDPFGPVSSGHAKIQGPLCQVTISKAPDYRDDSSCKINIELGQVVLMEEELDGMYCFDEQVEVGFENDSEVRAYLLLGGGRAAKGEAFMSFFSIMVYECLILVPAENPGSFRRIGYISLKPSREAVDSHKIYQALDSQFRNHTIPEGLYEKLDDDFMYTFTFV